MERNVAVLAVLLLSSIGARLPMASGMGSVIRVPADYATIQEAINAAAPDSMILVSSGVYFENLMIDKTLSLIGEDKTRTIIDGDRKWTVVEIMADSVVLDGFTIRNSSRSQGAGGVLLNNSQQSRISGNIIINNAPAGITLWSNSHDNLIEGNIVAFSGIILPGWIEGRNIGVIDSNNNTIVGNILSDAVVSDIELANSNNTIIKFNTVENSGDGLYLSHSSNNTVHHNVFLNNWYHLIVSTDSYSNVWDDGSEGNYWDDYVGLDDGSNGRVAGDGVGDTNLPHAGFDELGNFIGADNYPFVRPPMLIPVVWDNAVYPVAVEGTSTVSGFRFLQAQKRITFNVTGPLATSGYCNVTIPKSLLRDSPWRILRNGTDITSESIIAENGTHTSLYFTYNHSINNIQIIGTWVIPEYPIPTMIALALISTGTIALLTKRRPKKKLLI